jgi:hypothetical protein
VQSDETLAGANGLTDTDPRSPRVSFLHIVTKHRAGEKVLQGDCIETRSFVEQNGLKIDKKFYLTNQVMNPVAQLMALGLEELVGFNPTKHRFPTLEKKIAKLDRELVKHPHPTGKKKASPELKNSFAC